MWRDLREKQPRREANKPDEKDRSISSPEVLVGLAAQLLHGPKDPVVADRPGGLKGRWLRSSPALSGGGAVVEAFDVLEDAPTDDPAAVGVLDGRQIQPAFPRAQVGDVRDPEHVLTLGSKVAFDEVVGDANARDADRGAGRVCGRPDRTGRPAASAAAHAFARSRCRAPDAARRWFPFSVAKKAAGSLEQVALLAQPLVLTAQALKLGTLVAGYAVIALVTVDLVLAAPVAQRLLRDSERLGQLARSAA